jgi:sporulation protein YlmC with PRC-barrel domain
MTISKLFATVAATAMVSASAAYAQDTQQDTEQLDIQVQETEQQAEGQVQGQAQDQQVAQQCLEDIQQFRARMDEDGYWLSGAGGRWGWGVGPRAGTAPMTATEGTETAAPPPGQPIPDATTPGAAGAEPWGRTLTGMHSPSYQIRGLLTGARILAVRGNQQACDATLAELDEIYDEFVQQAQTAGIEPDTVLNWRQESLLAAQPVEQFDLAGLNVDDITGTDIRNPRDEHLGTVDDVLVDPDGSILYLIVSRGGFLGIGEEHVAIPWEGLQATPGLNTFVLEVDESVMEEAPRVDADRFVLPEVFEERRQDIDAYWQQHTAG